MNARWILSAASEEQEGQSHRLRAEAEELLASRATPTVAEARAGRARARAVRDDVAIALWSQLLVRALKESRSGELLA